MQSNQEPHHPRPKIAKNLSRLPEAFRVPATSSKRSSQPIQDQPRFGPIDPKPLTKQKKPAVKKSRKSQNPFLPIQQFMKKVDDFSRQMKQANSDINNLDRLAQYSIQGDRNKYKYENCLTLSIVRKNATGCLKKVLHVPTLTVHYLKQSFISNNFDKNELTAWMQVVNREEEACMRVLELFWNMPEDYYSLLYEYSQGHLLDSLNQSLHTIPAPILRDIASLHMGVSVSIFNAHLILNQEKQKQGIRYLPLYEDSQFSLSEMNRVKQIMESELGPSDKIKLGRKLSWRLGLLLLSGYLGIPILSQEVLMVQLPLKKCCLFHQIITHPNSLAAMYLELGGGLDAELTDFLCFCLRSNKNADNNMEPKVLRGHKWLSKKYTSVISLGELIDGVDPAFSKHSKFELNKMSRILDSVGLILQNVTGVDLSITSDHQGVRHLARELGMSDEISQVVTDLRRVYRVEAS